MKDIFEVAIFSIKEIAKKKTFIIVNVIFLVLILLAVNIPNLLNLFNFNADTYFIDNVLIVNSDYIVDDSLLNIEEYNLSLEYSIENNALSDADINNLITDDKYDYIISIRETDNNFNVDFISTDGVLTFNASSLIGILENMYIQKNILDLNLSVEQLLSITPNTTINNIALDQDLANDVEKNYSAQSVGTMVSMALFFSIYMFAFQVSTAVTTEKTSRIVETLLTSTSSKNIILGKTFGIGILGFIQIVVLFLFLIISASIFLPGDVVSSFLENFNISMSLIFVFLLYYILGYLLFSFLFALTGATVNRMEEVQVANTPVNLLLILGFYFGYFTLLNASSSLNYISGFIPISSPFSMPIRYVLGLASLTDLIVSVVILVVTIIIIANVSIKIYSNAILNNGSKMSLKNLINMYKQKDDI